MPPAKKKAASKKKAKPGKLLYTGKVHCAFERIILCSANTLSALTVAGPCKIAAVEKVATQAKQLGGDPLRQEFFRRAGVRLHPGKSNHPQKFDNVFYSRGDKPTTNLVYILARTTKPSTVALRKELRLYLKPHLPDGISSLERSGGGHKYFVPHDAFDTYSELVDAVLAAMDDYDKDLPPCLLLTAQVTMVSGSGSCLKRDESALRSIITKPALFLNLLFS